MVIQSGGYRRRRSRLPIILAIVAAILLAVVVWLASLDTEVPTRTIEQDVVDAAPRT